MNRDQSTHEVALEAVWRKATASGAGDCVEVAKVGRDEVLIRNSFAPDGAVLAFNGAEWAAFLDGVRAGEFDLLD